jgi:NADH:ubiquinone oxidoreductase subunit 3 (subunit A)
MTAFIEIIIFFFILGLGLLYAWKKHALIWE